VQLRAGEATLTLAETASGDFTDDRRRIFASVAYMSPDQAQGRNSIPV